MSYAVLGTIILFIIVLIFFTRRFAKISELQNRLETETEKNRNLSEKLESIVKTQNRILEIRNEKKPRKKTAPESGDSASRIERLNSL